MSYYMMAAEFWTAVGVGMGIVPVVVASAGKVASTFTRTPARFDAAAPRATRRAAAACQLFHV
ncbi:MAG TPA: hypothetical protein VHU80_22865 [Polyangiaceae bacterium]|jgi:hypothetical protein|nr:hypothetical protein [Polyangiaceae bacterium]